MPDYWCLLSLLLFFTFLRKQLFSPLCCRLVYILLFGDMINSYVCLLSPQVSKVHANCKVILQFYFGLSTFWNGNLSYLFLSYSFVRHSWLHYQVKELKCLILYVFCSQDPARSAIIDSCIRVTDNGRENINRKVQIYSVFLLKGIYLLSFVFCFCNGIIHGLQVFFIFSVYNTSNHNDQLKVCQFLIIKMWGNYFCKTVVFIFMLKLWSKYYSWEQAVLRKLQDGSIPYRKQL